MLKRIVALTAFFLTISYIAGAYQNSPFQMLRYNMSARAAGIGGCFEAMPEDPTALFFNPASVYTVKEKNFAATFFKHVLDINSGQVSYIREFENIGKLAASVSYTNYGSFDYADNTGFRNGKTFAVQDFSFGLTYSNQLDSNLYWGATLKFLDVILENYSSTAMAIDAGLLYSIPDKRTNIGISVLNAGMQLSEFAGLAESLPLDIRMGINHRLRGLPLLVNLSFHHLADKADNFFSKFLNFSIGGELYLGKYLQARLGYDNQIRQYTTPENDKKFSGFSAGIGIKMEHFNFDYAIAQLGTVSTLHRFSLILGI